MKRIPAWLTIPLLAFTLSRLLIFGMGILADTMLPTEEGHWVADENSPFLSMWAKWDSQYYVDIATNGYWYRPGQQSNVAFFPLYPMAMQVLAPALGGNLIRTGFLLANAAFLGALIFLYLLTELELDSASAGRTVFLLAFFPTSFFFSCVYTESFFLLLSVGTMYFARRHLWFPAAILGMLTAATRNLGILLWALVLWEWLRANGWSLGRLFSRDMWKGFFGNLRQHWFEVLVISVIPLGMVVYILFLQQNFGRPLAFIETQAAWGRQNVGPVAVIAKSLTSLAGGEVNKGWLTLLWNTSTLLFFLALVPFVWKRFGEGYAIYVLIQLLVPASSATGSIIRYVLTQFPAFMLLGWWSRHESVNRALLTSFTILLGVFIALFVNWLFVA